MRGEDLNVMTRVDAMTGSPPHARGRRRMVAEAIDDHGITPACAGKTGLRGKQP